MSSEEITRLLSALERGDSGAAGQLLPLVYQQLRELAAQRLRQESPGQTLQATALVHEAYLRLVEKDATRIWDSRGHFYAAAAEAMRRILVDRARRKRRLKHGGGRVRVEFREDLITERADEVDLLALDEGLDHLSEVDPEAAEMIKVRLFTGLSTEEAAKALGLSPRAGYRSLEFARAWLFRRLNSDDKPRAE